MSICDSSEFHDAEILVVAIDRESARAQLKCRLEDGQIRSVRFEGLKAFRSEDLTLQNVVSRVLRSSRAQISRDGVEYWLQWATSLSDADYNTIGGGSAGGSIRLWPEVTGENKPLSSG